MLLNLGRLSLGLALLTFSSCEAISGVAPEGTPRVEIELMVTVDAAFLEAIPGMGASSDLMSAIKRTVRDEADVGLRFYPTPSESYGANDSLPPYLMTVELSDLVLQFDHEKVEKEDGTTMLETRVAKIRCSAIASIEHRRGGGPSLLVGSTDGSGFAKAERDPERLQADLGFAVSHKEADVRILQRDFLRAVRGATKDALQGLRKPIDREFAPLATGR